MTSKSDIQARYRDALAQLQPRGQDHLFRWWEELGDADRVLLLHDVESINWTMLDGLIATHVVARPASANVTDLHPAPVHRQRPDAGREGLYDRAVQRGRTLIREGKVAAFTVAGGQGTRLGFDGPKGMIEVTPLGRRTLFQLFADIIAAAGRRYDVALPWYVMTSPANHDETLGYFKSQAFFGLREQDVRLFPQAMLPVFDRSGKVIMADKHRIALAPDGHGGSLKALVASGALADMQARGIEVISYFQVDNPLVKPFDPLFLGLHAETGSEMSVKVTPKANDLERVGNVCMSDGRVRVIEYSDLPEELAHATGADGSRTFDAANLAIHLLDVDFVDRVIAQKFQLPYHRAEKAVNYVDQAGSKHAPAEPNAVKLETFVFDALPLASKTLVLEVDRAEEFAPIKNAEGDDSLASAKEAQIARACRWLEDAGINVPRTAEGRPDLLVVIAPSLAMDADELHAAVDHIPDLHPGGRYLLE